MERTRELEVPISGQLGNGGQDGAAVAPLLDEDSKYVYEDEWREIIDRPSIDVIEVRWFDATASMSKEQFQQWLSTFAGSRNAVAPVTRPHRWHQFQDESSVHGWRLEGAHIIPRYNAAGVMSFAFLMPVEMPMVGKPPAREGPGRFPTGYFGSRKKAVGWLKR